MTRLQNLHTLIEKNNRTLTKLKTIQNKMGIVANSVKEGSITYEECLLIKEDAPMRSLSGIVTYRIMSQIKEQIAFIVYFEPNSSVAPHMNVNTIKYITCLEGSISVDNMELFENDSIKILPNTTHVLKSNKGGRALIILKKSNDYTH